MSQNKILCECCSSEISCDPNNISNCACSKVELNSYERSYIDLKFKSCLCNSCLLKLKSEANDLNKLGSSHNESKKILLLLIVIFSHLVYFSQTYAPAAGSNGTSAMHADSSAFINWASTCELNRGYQDISNQSLGFTTVGSSSDCLGKALSNGVLSLGDGGTAICTFNFPIINGPGFDFAVFENGITDTFLELAFVEVSSDGINFFRFKSHSLSDTLSQTGSFGSTDATKINNLAGKYRSGYGTPFDLQELTGISGLNINSITHIKIIDVVGALNSSYASFDGFGNKVNDPWPTPFPSSGFDLDAIGVIHENPVTAMVEESNSNAIKVFPNPLHQGSNLTISNSIGRVHGELLDLSGQILSISNSNQIETKNLSAGIYILKICQGEKITLKKIVIQ